MGVSLRLLNTHLDYEIDQSSQSDIVNKPPAHRFIGYVLLSTCGLPVYECDTQPNYTRIYSKAIGL